jgi:hypothetical protein
MPQGQSRISESIVQNAALDWLGGLGYEILSGLAIALCCFGKRAQGQKPALPVGPGT